MSLLFELPILLQNSIPGIQTTSSQACRVEVHDSSCQSVLVSSHNNSIKNVNLMQMDLKKTEQQETETITFSNCRDSSIELMVSVSLSKIRRKTKAVRLSNGFSSVFLSTEIDARLCSVLIHSFQSKNFRNCFVINLIRHCGLCSPSLTAGGIRSVSLFLSPRWPVYIYIDYAFSKRVLSLSRQRLDLEVAMAWLSTLGGGFSALGDYFSSAAEKAGRISLAQMKLAEGMGDPIIVSKSWIWFSLSLIQKGKIDMARWIVIMQLRFSRTKAGNTDPRLKRMCKGVLARIKYMKSCQEEEKEGLDR